MDLHRFRFAVSSASSGVGRIGRHADTDRDADTSDPVYISRSSGEIKSHARGKCAKKFVFGNLDIGSSFAYISAEISSACALQFYSEFRFLHYECFGKFQVNICSIITGVFYFTNNVITVQ